MKLLNKDTDRIPKTAIYIGRGSGLGNTFEIGRDGTRDEVIAKNLPYLIKEVDTKNPVILSKLLKLKEDSQLACYCFPLPCHGQNIERVWRDYIQNFMPERSLFYAGIGARDFKIPKDRVGKLSGQAKRCAARLNELGFWLRSGAATGFDSYFESGAGDEKEIFLPYPGFNKHPSLMDSPSPEAFRLAEHFHPLWRKLDQSAKQMMARNCHQVLGSDLRTYADFVVCWTADGAESSSERTKDTGGTGMAIDLASTFRIPVFNLERPDALQRLKIHLDSHPMLSRDAANDSSPRACSAA